MHPTARGFDFKLNGSVACEQAPGEGGKNVANEASRLGRGYAHLLITRLLSARPAHPRAHLANSH